MRECCTDHKGHPKRKYKTKAEAEKVAQLRCEEGVNVSVYPCEEGNGWHLTSRNTQHTQAYESIMVQKELLRYKQKSKNPLRNVIDEELSSQIKKMALTTLEKKIEETQEKIDQQITLYKSNKKSYVEIRNTMREIELKIRDLKSDMHNYQQEYNIAKRRLKQ